MVWAGASELASSAHFEHPGPAVVRATPVEATSIAMSWIMVVLLERNLCCRVGKDSIPQMDDPVGGSICGEQRRRRLKYSGNLRKL